MNYKERFNKIADKIGKRRKIEGIERIFRDGEYISITVNGIEITRGHSDCLYTIELSSETGWEFLDNMQEKIAEWFSCVEEKVKDYIPSEVIVDGRTYKLVE